ncbi:EF-hand domain-containing protein (plasmid) [Catenovulum sp. SX2]|uniref:EF-hand domain-containing protein n=1 Tax=Catenovulum sp. SX2 TaxID=3398614 RepID=UPI003F877196
MKFSITMSLVSCLLFSAGSYAKPPRPCFAQLDVNSDDVLSYAEFSAELPPHHSGEDIFAQMDVNADQLVSKSEFAQFKPDHTSKFSLLDNNSDGVISYAEFTAMPIPHGDYQTVFNTIDVDGSGDITAEEMQTHHQQMRHRKPHHLNKKMPSTTGECND